MRAYDVELDQISGPSWIMDNMGPNVYQIDALSLLYCVVLSRDRSYRSASTGLLRVARCAGNQTARNATTISVTGTHKKTIGSLGVTPYSRLAIR